MISIEDFEHLNAFGDNQEFAIVPVHCWCARHVALFRIFDSADVAFTMAGQREVYS